VHRRPADRDVLLVCRQIALEYIRVWIHIRYRKKVRLRRRFVCPADGKEVHPEHIVRGYEIDKDQYVVVRDEELEGCAPEKTRTIEITDFVELSEIDPMFFDRPYYVLPQAGSSKPYRLLVDAMTRSKRAETCSCFSTR
jgi:DNA end-binding protein Ku